MDEWRARLGTQTVECIDALARDLDEILGSDLIALWLYGAIAFEGSEDRVADLDFHAIIARPPPEEAARALASLSGPLDLDGYYVLLEDARSAAPPRSQIGDATDDAWALHRAHFHAGRVIVVRGPHPRDVVPPAVWEEIERALRAEFDLTLAEWPDTPYAVLQTCRVMLSLTNRDAVVSKAEAARWALRELPVDWHELVRAADRFYRGASSNGDRALIASRARSFVEWAREADSVERARAR